MNNSSLKPILDAIECNIKSITEELSSNIPGLIEEGTATIKGIKQDAQEAWNEFIQKMNEKKMPANVIATEVEFLNSGKLLEIAKENIIPDSNEVYAIKKEKENAYFIYLAYGKDKNPFEKEQNKYVIIKAEGLSKDIINLFSDSELVILK